MGKQQGVKVVATNRKAHHDFTILETMEAGIALKGTEVKSLRQGKANLNDAFGRIDNGECYVYELHISPYEFGNRFNPDPKRPRKLLLHKKEIRKLHSEIKEKGLTLVPLKIYFVRGIAKMELGLAKGKKLYDKRQDMAKKDARRHIEQSIKEFQKR
ncbi:MAG: SsrA-binding protein SmpB [Bacillota bacterium]|nr:SsrA-binding protein SmpB [Bacillota bacterium]